MTSMRDYATDTRQRPLIINLDRCEIALQVVAVVGVVLMSAYIFWMGFCEVTQ